MYARKCSRCDFSKRLKSKPKTLAITGCPKCGRKTFKLIGANLLRR